MRSRIDTLTPAELATLAEEQVEADRMVAAHTDSHGLVYVLLRETRARELRLIEEVARLIAGSVSTRRRGGVE